MKWTKFKDRNKIFYKCCFVTDWASAWVKYFQSLDDWDHFARENPEYAYADIEIPETPPEPMKKHYCIFGAFSCEETEKKGLVISHADGSWHNCSFCPKCGYAKKQYY